MKASAKSPARRCGCACTFFFLDEALFRLGAVLLSAHLAGAIPLRAAEVGPPSNADTSINRLALTPAQREKIHTAAVQPTTFRRTLETTATVGFDEDRSTSVLAPVGGPVSRLMVSLGAQVKPGDILATVVSPDYATAISAYRKAVATAKNARRIAQLTEELSRNNLSRREVEQAQTDAANAEADRAAALEQLRSLGVEENTIGAIDEGKPVPEQQGNIRSPIAGTVVERLITPGQLLQAGITPCFTIADPSVVWVTANLFGSDLALVQVGDPAEIVATSSATNLPGTVDYIGSIVDTNTRAIGVRVVVDNPNGLLKKQMYVRAMLHSRQPQTGLLVPVSAVLRDDENLPFVYLAGSDGSFSRRRITLGSRAGDQYEVTAGLSNGEQVVVEGGLFLQFMQNQ